MSVNHFGPYTVEEELEMRVNTIDGDLLRTYEGREEARRTFLASDSAIENLWILRNEYVKLHGATQREASDTQWEAAQMWAHRKSELDKRIDAILSPDHD